MKYIWTLHLKKDCASQKELSKAAHKEIGSVTSSTGLLTFPTQRCCHVCTIFMGEVYLLLCVLLHTDPPPQPLCIEGMAISSCFYAHYRAWARMLAHQNLCVLLVEFRNSLVRLWYAPKSITYSSAYSLACKLLFPGTSY